MGEVIGLITARGGSKSMPRKNILPWMILIKPHPSEDATAYHGLSEPGFMAVSNRATHELLSECDIKSRYAAIAER